MPSRQASAGGCSNFWVRNETTPLTTCFPAPAQSPELGTSTGEQTREHRIRRNDALVSPEERDQVAARFEAATTATPQRGHPHPLDAAVAAAQHRDAQRRAFYQTLNTLTEWSTE